MVKAAVLAFTPPPFDEVEEAAAKAGLQDTGPDWVRAQFQIFLELSRQRGRGQAVQPILFSELVAYQELNSIELHPIEVNNLLAMDAVFLEVVTEMIDESIEQARNKAGA